MTLDFVFGLYVIATIVLVLVMTLLIGFAARGWFPKIKFLRVGLMRTVPVKKIQPNWGNRCRSCGGVIQAQERCPSCGLTPKEALDKNLFNYLSANDGVLSRSQAASDLRTSPAELNASLERLITGHKIFALPEDTKGQYTV